MKAILLFVFIGILHMHSARERIHCLHCSANKTNEVERGLKAETVLSEHFYKTDTFLSNGMISGQIVMKYSLLQLKIVNSQGKNFKYLPKSGNIFKKNRNKIGKFRIFLQDPVYLLNPPLKKD